MIAKRCASSRRRWSRYSACELAGSTSGVVDAGQEHLLAFLGQSEGGHVVQAQLVEHLARGVDLAHAAVDDDQVRQPPAQLLGDPLLCLERPVEAAAQHLAM